MRSEKAHNAYSILSFSLAQCPLLMNPGNGTVVVVGNSRGYMASYSCNPGFDLVGVSVRVCGDDGEWSDEAPMCIRK